MSFSSFSKSEHIAYGAEVVSGEVIGDISHRYNAVFKTVEVWPKHNHREEYPSKAHGFWSTLTNQADAISEYIASKRQNSLLGDGSPCIVTLELVS